MKKIGIFGGTFDPIHFGHLSLIEAGVRELDFERAILMPAHVSPFKLEQITANDRDRLAMAELAAKESCDRIEVSDFEIKNEDISYTYNTLSEFRRRYPGYELWFMLGTDSLLTLDKWYRGPELLCEFCFALAARPGYRQAECKQKRAYYEKTFGTKIAELNNRQLDISSTEIRRSVSEGKSISGLVPETVERYIHEHGLYRSLSQRASV